MRNVGIEIENESASVGRGQVLQHCSMPGSMWEVDGHEGSLRAGQYGWEIRTKGQCGQPLGAAIQSLYTLYPLLQNSSGVWRAAVHVHVDVRDYSRPRQALALALAYVFDASMFELSSPERVESNFCVPLAHKSDAVRSTIAALRSGYPHEGHGKYSSVNANCLNSFGTLEFRHMRTPECGSTVDSVTSALASIELFVEAAHSIVELAGIIDEATVATAFPRAVVSALATCSYRPMYGLKADPEATLDILHMSEDPVVFDTCKYDLGSLERVSRVRRAGGQPYAEWMYMAEEAR